MWNQALLKWYRDNPREYPWRDVAIDPYIVLVSEIMLQQTQARTVAKRLPEFLKLFPSLLALARASNAEMILAWQGLGYNNRAIRLRDAAIAIRDNHGGVVPTNEAALAELPGIGAYASASIVCFAYNRRTTVVDVNVRRVYSRSMRSQPTTASVESLGDVRLFAESVIPRTNAAEWHHAVMDLGSVICTARKPLCDSCPLQATCPSANVMLPATRVKRAEPTFYGQPNRIWRGRIVKLVHGAQSNSLNAKPRTDATPAITRRGLFKHLTSATATAHDLAWLDGVLRTLQTDGMLNLRGSNIFPAS